MKRRVVDRIHIHVLVDVPRLGQRALLRELNCASNRFARFFFHCLDLAFCNATLKKLGFEESERVMIADVVADLLRGAIRLAVGAETDLMLIEAIGFRLDQRRPFTAARPVDSALCDLIHCEYTLAVHGVPRDAVALRPLPYLGLPMTARSRRGHGVSIVLAKEDDWQLPYGSHVKRLVERALIAGPIAEECEPDLVGTARLG